MRFTISSAIGSIVGSVLLLASLGEAAALRSSEVEGRLNQRGESSTSKYPETPLAIRAGLSSQFDSYAVFQSIQAPKNWEYQELAPTGHTINLRIGLKLQNVEQFHQMAIDIGTPDHPSYGQHMSQDEINAILNPSKESARLVLEWLESFGAHGVHDNQWVKADLTVSQAQELLQTQYGVYLNTISGKTAIRTLSYHLPSILRDHIDLVQPTTMFGLEPLIPRTHRGKLVRRSAPMILEQESSLEDCNHRMTIACLRQLYNMEDYKPHGRHTSIGVAGFLGEYGNRADLQTFFKMYRPDFLGKSYTTVLVNGGLDNQTQPGTEANLDIQYVAGLTFPNSLTYYSVGGSPPFISDSFTRNNTNEPYLEFLCYLSTQSKIPQTISISYGDDEQTVPKDYASRVCTEFAQLGARGTTVLVSSGDFGVGAGNCLTNDGRNATRFIPGFPASCPFVTTVGATNGTSPEVGVDFSGGGFSEYFPQPCYQKTKVESYLDELGDTYAGLFNPKGRAFPDVSAQGSAFQVVVGGEVISVDGTSASAPAFAAIICLINDHRLAHGKKPLGFLNPLLYSCGENALNDIVSGNNPGCDTTGFWATTGWDPITGLGTPNLAELLVTLK